MNASTVHEVMILAEEAVVTDAVAVVAVEVADEVVACTAVDSKVDSTSLRIRTHQGRLRMVRLCNTVRTLLQTSHNSHNMAIRKHLRQTCITLVSLRHRQRRIKVKELVEPDRPVRKLRLASMVSWRR